MKCPGLERAFGGVFLLVGAAQRQFISLCMFSLGAWLLVKNFRELGKQPKADLSALTGANSVAA